ncbi:putative adhesin [Paraburkholderia tuberum]|nr:hypothetical protein [Paraburkholderia tuberum]
MISTTKDDAIIVGHGTYRGGAATFTVPAGVELHISQTVGSAMTVSAAGMLLSNTPVNRGALIHPPKGYDDFAALGLVTVYAAGAKAPNLILHDIGAQAGAINGWAAKGNSAVVLVNADALLADLLTSNPIVTGRVKAAVSAGKTVRVFWAACAVQEQRPQFPSVYFNGRAVAQAALAYSRANPTNIPAKNAAAAADQWSMSRPGDTAGTVAAAAKIDVTTASLLKPL